MTPDERARTVLQLWLHEAQATEGARISHGAIRAKFAARAGQCRAAREDLWEGAADQPAVVDSLLDVVGHLLDKLTDLDPSHRSASTWLADVGVSPAPGAAPTPR